MAAADYGNLLSLEADAACLLYTSQDFSRAERAAVKEKLALSAFLRGFYESNRPDIELGGQRFALELPREELYVSAGETQLRAALENLCYNALSFTPPGGRITLSLRREGGSAVICVADTGSGIAPEDLPLSLIHI